MRIIIIVKEDIKLFPPVLTILESLLETGHTVEVIGHYSDYNQKDSLVSKGLVFHDTGLYDVTGSLFSKLKGNIRYRSRVKKIVASLNLTGENYYLWILQGKTICLLHKLIRHHPSILHPLEFTDKHIKLFYRILSPRYNAVATFQAARKVVCCEYNRAQITKGIFGLSKVPYVLPNKMIIDEAKLSNPPHNIKEKVNEIADAIKGKKVILYQGIFLKGERRLEEFCKAVQGLGNDYILVLMGNHYQSGYKELQNQFKGAKNILFVPFINPPYHLLVTRLANIGVLTYFPSSDSIANVLNPLYCAPNKIFEYGKYGIPMIGNDIPGLHYIFKEFNSGLTIDYPIQEEDIMKAASAIFNNYNVYSQGSKKYFNSVDVQKIIEEIVK